jgi:glycosyltransferase involved in cell wall biosynthesis
MFDAVADRCGFDLHVLACAAVEPQRGWQLPKPRHYNLKVLPGLRHHVSYTSHVYFNPTVLIELARLRPDVIHLAAFSPTMLIAGQYALLTRTPFGVGTDGSVDTDPGRVSLVHRLARRAIVPRASYGVGASEDSRRLLAQYGLGPERTIVVPIVTAWDAPREWTPREQRPWDVLLCGAIDEHRKGALFFADVMARCKQQGLAPRVRIVGDGPLRDNLRARLEAAGIDARFDGYLQPDQLPEAYSSAKLLLFPSRGDPWGLVANEAILCGTPLIASPHAVSSMELVEVFDAGVVLPLEIEAWSQATLALLGSPARWRAHQANHVRARQWFSLERAVERIAATFSAAAKGMPVGRLELS